MARYKFTDNKQLEMVVVDFKDQLIFGTFEYGLNEIINNLDLSLFDLNYKNDLKGASAYNPRILIKLILFSYSKGILSSRKIEDLCKKHVTFMALCEGTTPDHSTISHFLSMIDQTRIMDLFTKVLVICNELNLIGGEVFAVDGCKISSNASKESSGTFKELERKKDKMNESLKLLINKHKTLDKKESETMEKRIIKFEKKIKRIKEFLENNEEKNGSRKRICKSNITDNESGKMISSHGFIQGYNGISVVDSKNQIVIYTEAFGSGQEGMVLIDTLEKTKMALKANGINKDLKGKKVICDTNYFSETNCEYLYNEKIDGYIPDQHFRNRDPRFPDKNEKRKRKNLYRLEDFTYDEKTGNYICPQGKQLKCKKHHVKSHNYIVDKFFASIEDCSNCNQAYKCLIKGSKSRSLIRIIDYLNRSYSELMMNKIDSEEGRDIYSRRMGIVEPVFGNIVFHKRMNYFNRRGKKKVNVQWVLFNLVHNIEKIINKGNQYKKAS